MAGASEFDHELCIPSDTTEGHRIQQLLLEKLGEHAYPDKVVFGIRLAIEEALVNAIKHGNQMDRDKQVRVRYSVTPEKFTIEVTDEGSGFRPEEVPDPTAPENLERPCGRGLMLMRAYMQECTFVPPGNVCRMSRTRD